MINKKLTAEKEKFCEDVAAGISLVDAFISYRPAAAAWQRDSAHNKASALARRPAVAERIEQLKQALRQKSEKKFIWTAENSIKVLAQIALKGHSESARVSAVGKLNDMLGYNAPKKLDHTSSDGSLIAPRMDLDLKRLDDNILKALIDARKPVLH